MPLRKCPKCELNYILDDQPYCTVCLKEAKGIDHHDDEGELCPLCGEREIVFGEEYCAECLLDLKKLDSKQHAGEEVVEEDEEEVDAIADLEEIALDEEAEAVPAFELEHINEALTEDEAFPEADDALDEDEDFEGDEAKPFGEDDDE